MAPYIGTSTSRVDGFEKVTGAAKYAAEFNVPGLAYGSVVTSTIAKGRIVRIDPSAALRVKGVLDVLTHENRPPMADNDQAYKDDVAPAGSPFRPLYDSRIMFNGQPIALVVAETSEIARFAASLVRVEYETEAHITDVYRQREAAIPVKLGGGFGSGLRPQFEVVLAVLAARALRRSVRVVLTRPQMYVLGYRPAMIQRIELGANTDGTLDAIMHDAITVTSQYEEYFRQETGWSGLLYKCANAKYDHKLARLDLATACDMRAPSAPTAMFALESAMDELAVALKLDPLELRLRCYSERDQNNDRPFSSKALRECYTQGAEAFGWDKRNPEVRSMRDDGDLVGWGMATGVWEALQMPITVRIVLSANGHAEVACATSDIGTGTYTIMAQVAADMLGLPLENISIKLGDSSLPQSPVEGGSWIAASVCNGIATTADAIRDELLRLAKQVPSSPLANTAPGEVALADGKLVSKSDASRSVSIADAMRHSAVDRIEQEKTTNPSNDTARAHNTHAAMFAEVKVDEQLGVIRVTRVVSAVAAGRILNTKTASSQILGSVVWGIGMALHEETLIDHRVGRIMNANIAEYHVPVNADIYDIRVIFVDEPDDGNPLGIKGLGEIGIVGVAAAIANAVYHATGKRVRELPITLDKLRP